jgi:hypothetical protein
MSEQNQSELDSVISALGTAISNTVHGAMSAEDADVKALASVKFVAKPDGTLTGLGLSWTGAGPNKQLMFRASPDRFWSTESIDLNEDKAFMIGNNVLLSKTELGSSVRTSNLSKVGTLNNLRTQGDLVIDDYIYYTSSSESLGIGTEAPNGKLGIATLDGEFVVDTAPGKISVGAWTSTDLHIVTDNRSRMVIGSNGNIVIGNEKSLTTVNGILGVNVSNVDDAAFAVNGGIKLEGKKITYAHNQPTDGSCTVGDITFNLSPKSGGYVGWVCTESGTPGVWNSFGKIS